MSVAYAEVLLDAHVHYHRGFSRRVFFDAAWRNLSLGERQLRIEGTLANVTTVAVEKGAEGTVVEGSTGAVARGLMFTESNGVDVFAELVASAEAARQDPTGAEPRTEARGGGTTEWSFRATDEANSLWAIRPSSNPSESRPSERERILLIAGRQLVTREGLEVLALGCRTDLPDGMGLREARDAAIDQGAVPVVPWGFGKWWFSRGRLLAELLGADSPGRWFLGDNAGRPQLSRRPELFDRAADRGVFVLPGSDPLPLAGQDGKPGRCGFRLPLDLDSRRPAAAIAAALRAVDRQPTTFGQYEGLAGFARNQVAMQMRKRRAADSDGESGS